MQQRIFRFLFCAFVVFLTGCASAPKHPSLSVGSLKPLVPVRSYVADTQSAGGHQISPDGKKLLWFARVGLGPGVYLKDLESGLTRLIYKGGAWPTWAADSASVYLTASRGGDENTQVYRLDLNDATGAIKNITPFANRRATIQNTVEGSGDLLIQSNHRDPKFFDLYYFNQAQATLAQVAENPGDVFYWATDRQGRLFGRARKVKDDLVFEQRIVSNGDTTWQRRFSWSYFESVVPLDLDTEGQFLWALSNRGRDKQALVKLNMSNGEEAVVFEDGRVDVTEASINRKTNLPLFATIDPGYQEQKFFDNAASKMMEKMMINGTNDGAGLLSLKPSSFSLSSVSSDGMLMTGLVMTATGGANVLVDLNANKVTVIADSLRGRIHAQSGLPTQTPISFKSRDGLTIHGYLTLPVGVAPKKLPTVLFVHGGPWHRDTWGSEPQAMFLANRGYAVLQVNYRGSTGYGRDFRDKAIGEFAKKMQDDLNDGVDWLIAQGTADAEKIAIAGASYGGYAALVGLTFTPDKFACGIDFIGPTDLARLLETTPPYWETYLAFWYKFTGDPKDPKQRETLNERSPFYKVAEMKKPVLIVHSVNDARVKLEQSERMVAALQKAGKSVEYVRLSGDGHGNLRWSNSLALYRKSEDFLSRCLGGASRGFDLFQLASWAL
jgi:dipeptidyl aminopeptidase/acylaminoacyl peptidase